MSNEPEQAKRRNLDDGNGETLRDSDAVPTEDGPAAAESEAHPS